MYIIYRSRKRNEITDKNKAWEIRIINSIFAVNLKYL